MSAAADLTVTVSEYQAGTYFNPANGHYYKPVTSGTAVGWTAAGVGARSGANEVFGLTGYLATFGDPTTGDPTCAVAAPDRPCPAHRRAAPVVEMPL